MNFISLFVLYPFQWHIFLRLFTAASLLAGFLNVSNGFWLQAQHGIFHCLGDNSYHVVYPGVFSLESDNQNSQILLLPMVFSVLMVIILSIAVSNLFLHLKIDLSQYAEETGKSLTSKFTNLALYFIFIFFQRRL